MKNNALTVALLGMLLVSACFSAERTYRYVVSLRKLRGLQPTIFQINYNRNFMQALLNETQEYSKKYPALEPLLQSVSQKNSTGVAAPAPAGPATK